MEQFAWRKYRKTFLKALSFFPIRETVFKVSAQIFVIILRDIIGLEKFLLSFSQS